MLSCMQVGLIGLTLVAFSSADPADPPESHLSPDVKTHPLEPRGYTKKYHDPDFDAICKANLYRGASKQVRLCEDDGISFNMFCEEWQKNLYKHYRTQRVHGIPCPQNHQCVNVDKDTLEPIRLPILVGPRASSIRCYTTEWTEDDILTAENVMEWLGEPAPIPENTTTAACNVEMSGDTAGTSFDMSVIKDRFPFVWEELYTKKFNGNEADGSSHYIHQGFVLEDTDIKGFRLRPKIKFHVPPPHTMLVHVSMGFV